MIWIHEGLGVWVAREGGLQIKVRPNGHRGRYYLLITDHRRHAMFDSKGALEDLKEIAEHWVEGQKK